MIDLINTDQHLLDAYSQTVSNIYNTISPSVVHIRNVRSLGKPKQRDEKNESMGSGFLISSDGYIISNHHVADSAHELYVTMDDGTTLRAELKGSDASTDIAVLKVE